MGGELKDQLGAEIELIASSDGVFEVKADGDLIFSKKSLLRFPEEGEIQSLIKIG